MRQKQFIGIERTRLKALRDRFGTRLTPEIIIKMAENPLKYDPLLKGLPEREWSLEEEASFRRRALSQLAAEKARAGGGSQ